MNDFARPGGSPLRVVLVEDDASVRRFVAMALENLRIELIQCADVAQAMAALRQRPAQLVISDLMMPGESGLVLVERLARQDELRAGALVAVFSAGMQADTRVQLESLGVWRILTKPASLATLRGCVEAARLHFGAGGASGVPAPPVPPQADIDETRCVAEYFDGNQGLYESYKAMCRAQFRLDVQAGDAACLASEPQALKHLAHSLKSVLRCLGHVGLAEMARNIEQAAAAGDFPHAAADWTTFRVELSRLALPSDDACG